MKKKTTSQKRAQAKTKLKRKATSTETLIRRLDRDDHSPSGRASRVTEDVNEAAFRVVRESTGS